MPRVIAWFSCGDASAVATKLAIKKYGLDNLVIARICIDAEHSDNDRFAADCERWYGMPITELRSKEYTTTWDVWEKRRYIAGIAGAPCTTELKKVVRKDFQRPDDIHVFGYTVEERKRAGTFRHNNPDIVSIFPLIDAELSKSDCHALVRATGIELPMMYRLGFDNNNCIGCPKGGAGYWNMIRKHFPATFDRMAKLSRELGARLIRQDGERVFLDELRPETGRQKDEVEIECSPHCGDVLQDMKEDRMTYLVTWKGNHQNIDIGRYADKATATRVFNGIENPEIGGVEVDTELDLVYTKTELVDLFNKLGEADDPKIGGFSSKAEGQRQVFARIEELALRLPLTEVAVIPEIKSEASASEGQTEAVASEQPASEQQETDMATAKKTAKTKKPAKAKTVKAKTTNGAGKDAFGLRTGSKASQAAAMFARKNGATMADVNEATGANQYNLIKTLTDNGFKVQKEDKTFFLMAKS